MHHAFTYHCKDDKEVSHLTTTSNEVLLLILLSVCAAFLFTHLFISTRAKRWSRDLPGRVWRGEFSPLFLPSFRYQDCLVFYFEILLEFCIYHYFITCVKNLASLKFVLQGNLYE